LVIKFPNRANLKEGDQGEEVEVLQQYLETYGYIQPTVEDKLRAFGPRIDRKRVVEQPSLGQFDNRTKQALKNFQAFNKLNVTGTLTKETIKLMMEPRCGVYDMLEEFVTTGTKWSKTDLTYHFENYSSDLDQVKIKEAIRGAFDEWDSVSILTFKEVPSGGDIKLRFVTGQHGDGSTFDGVSGTLAHAFFPGTGMDGQVCFDEMEFWSDDDSGTHLQTVALHEFGHTLGLRHSEDTQAIMYAYYGGISIKTKLDDQNGIRSIYGV
jgi:peptidoglycan hydrolase-like protein with peptidoglycan-binding domain